MDKVAIPVGVTVPLSGSYQVYWKRQLRPASSLKTTY